MSVVHNWKPYPVYSGVELFGETPEQGNNEKIIFQTGFIGLTGCVISYPVILSGMKKPQMNADERRLIALFHREERNAQMHKSLYLEEIIRPGTRMTRIKRIYTDGFQHDDRRFVNLATFMEDKAK